MLSSLKTFLQRIPGGAGAAGAASVAAVAILTIGVYRAQVSLPPPPSTKPVAVVSPAQTVAPPPIPVPAAKAPAPAEPIAAPVEAKAPVPAPVDAVPVQPMKPKVLPPAFDVARVEPTGETLVAGRADPNNNVDLLDSGKLIGQIKTDATGQFVLLPKGLEPGSHLLSLRTKSLDGTVLPSEQNITVVVPQNKKEEVLVALTAPGEATKILSDAKPAPVVPAAAPAAKSVPAEAYVLIRTVEAGEGGALFATGTALPGQVVQLYLSGTAIAKATTAADGHWSLKVAKGMKPGAYQVRADALNEKGEVVARSEVPFDYPAEAVAAPVQVAAETKTPVAANSAGSAAAPATVATETSSPSPQTTTPAAAPSAADAVVKQLDTAIVSRGDSLWRISRKVYGRGIRYTQIYEANNKQIRDPKLIYPGQVFVLPADVKN